MKWLSTTSLVLVLFTSGCSHLNGALSVIGLEQAPPTEAELLTNSMVGKTFELRHSHFYGDLYDENEFMLLAPYPFREVFHLVDFDGNPIHPRNQRGVIPAGTKVKFREFREVDEWSSLNRMLTSPRYHTWLVVELIDTHDLLPSEQEPFVILLSAGLEDVTVRKAAIERWLSPVGETSGWLGSLSERAQKAIAMKAPFPGMHKEELLAAMGPPQMWIAEQGPKGQRMVAWYPHTEAWVSDKLVVSLHQQRPNPQARIELD